ncbi:MAG: hypothetical protein HYV41_00930 [Candidatus Magasanikbacteria bacterium]|nr:hypothetical protein [Candidatus Magasanikbacteria bacterium]
MNIQNKKLTVGILRDCGIGLIIFGILSGFSFRVTSEGIQNFSYDAGTESLLLYLLGIALVITSIYLKNTWLSENRYDQIDETEKKEGLHPSIHSQ